MELETRDRGALLPGIWTIQEWSFSIMTLS
jgi:hypothetical protein